MDARDFEIRVTYDCAAIFINNLALLVKLVKSS